MSTPIEELKNMMSKASELKIKPVINKAMGKELIPVLIKTGQTELLWALLASLALVLETN